MGNDQLLLLLVQSVFYEPFSNGCTKKFRYLLYIASLPSVTDGMQPATRKPEYSAKSWKSSIPQNMCSPCGTGGYVVPCRSSFWPAARAGDNGKDDFCNVIQLFKW